MFRAGWPLWFTLDVVAAVFERAAETMRHPVLDGSSRFAPVPAMDVMLPAVRTPNVNEFSVIALSQRVSAGSRVADKERQLFV